MDRLAGRYFRSWRDAKRLKLSGLVSETDWTSWSEDDLRVYVNAVLTAFGPPVVPNGAHLINSLCDGKNAAPRRHGD
jgi:hypothetical protein